jgi:hypothetical protein
MNKRKAKTRLSFRKQMAQSMADLESIMRGHQDFSGNGRFTVRRIRKAGGATACSRPPEK